MSGPQHVLNYRSAHDQGYAHQHTSVPQQQQQHQQLPPMHQGSHQFAAPHASASGHGFGHNSASWGHASEYATSQGSGVASLPGNPSTDNIGGVSSYGSEFAAPSSGHNDMYGRQGHGGYPQEPAPFSNTGFDSAADAPYPMHAASGGPAPAHKFEPGLSFADPSTGRASILNGAPPLSNTVSHLGPVRSGGLNGAPRPKPPKKPPLGRTDISSAADPEHAKEVLRTLRARHPDSSEPAPSCDRCRRRKIRCDREKPTCGNCVQSGRPCTTDDVLRKRGPPSKKERELMEAAGIVFHGARPKQKKGPKPPPRSAPGSSSGVANGARGGVAPSGFAAPAGSVPGSGAPARESWNDILANMTEPSRPMSHTSISSWQQQHQPSRSLDLDAGHQGYPQAPASWDNHGRSRPASPGHGDSGRRLFPHGAVGMRPPQSASSLRSASSVHTWDPSRPDDAYGGQSPSVDTSSVDFAHARGASNASGVFPSNASMLSASVRSSVPAPALPGNGTLTPPTWSRDEQRWQNQTSPEMAQSWHSGRNSIAHTSGPLYVIDAEGEMRQRDPALYYRSVSDIMRQWPDGPAPSMDPDPRVMAPGPSGASVWANAQAETPRSRWQVDRLISHELATVLLEEYFSYQNHIHPFLYEPRVRSIFYALQELAVERLDGRVSGNSSARSWTPLQLRYRQALILGILAMTSCTSDGLALQGGGNALAWEYGHGCFHLARDLLSPTTSMGGWPSLGQDALGGQENAQLERIQALAIMGIYLANEASRETTREVLRMGWDLGCSIDAHRSRSFAVSDPRRCDDVDREMLKRSMWACFMMLQMVRLAAPEQRKGVYPAAEEVSQLDVPVHLHPSIENEPALEAWVSELRVDVILASVLDSPLAAPPMTTGKAFENEQQVHDTHLRESWARELLSQLDNWASSAVCYDTRPVPPSMPRSFNLKKSRANHQICRSLIRNGLANVGSLFNVGEDPRVDGPNQHEPEEPQDRVSAWISTTPSVAIRALCGDKRTSSPWEQGSA